MRNFDLKNLPEKISKMCMESNYYLDELIHQKLKKSEIIEESKIAKSILQQIIENSEIAKNERVPMCQDTGIVVVFVEVGTNLRLIGNLEDAIHQGIRHGYQEGYLRKSVVAHPLKRINTKDNTPAVIHYKIVEGDKLKITIAPKGAGSENQSQLRMLKPSDGIQGVKDFVIGAVKKAGGNPCPPLIVGVGIGGNFEKCALLAKEALMRPLDDCSSDEIANQLEEDLLVEINNLNVGPMGFGGKTTALAVKVNTYPCHIASLPVAVNIQCHASRHISGVF